MGQRKQAVLFFIISWLFCTILVGVTIYNRSHVEKLMMEQLIYGKSIEITKVISGLLYKTQALAGIVIENNGEIRDFDRVAVALIDDPAIINLLIAPGGVVEKVYPMEGNEAVLGLNMLGEGAGNKEAIQARESGELVFGGPFELIQGGQALVGRMPVFINQEFWGLVSVTLCYPLVLDNAYLNQLEQQGYGYEIWRINPDNNERQVIATSHTPLAEDDQFIEKHMGILNADWYFRVGPVRQWYQYPETWIMIFSELLICLLLAITIQKNCDLRQIKTRLENMARTDALTEIYNKCYFIEYAPVWLAEHFRNGEACFVIIFDVDHFKRVNDTYGHMAGDKVLKNLSRLVKGRLEPTCLFARYGGEEFIILASAAGKAEITEAVEGIRKQISEAEVSYDDLKIHISVSFGIAPVQSPEQLEEAMRLADVALYQAKKTGRNRSVFLQTLV